MRGEFAQARGSAAGGGAAVSLGTRTQPLLLGLIVFLASEMMFFAGLFAAYYSLRTIDPQWPPPGVRLDVTFSSLGTALLALSDGTMLLTQRALARGRARTACAWLGTTLALGAAFIAVALYGWSIAPFSLASHAYGSLFFTLTGFHALHVFAGVVVLGGLLLAIAQGAYRRGPFTGVDAVAYYWHFVFIVWLGIYLTLYWVR